MIPQYDFDRLYDQEKTNTDRNVMNRGDMPDGVGFSMSAQSEVHTRNRTHRYESVEFTDGSASYMSPMEDEELLNGRVKPAVAGYYENTSGYDSKVYDPMNDMLIGTFKDPSSVKVEKVGKLPRSAFGLPDFLKDPVSLVIASVLLFAIVVLEIIALIVVF